MIKTSDSPRTAVVTGAGRGLGRAIATTLAQEMSVALVARSDDEIRRVAEEIERGGGIATCYRADLSSTQAISKLFDQIMSNHNGVHVMVNNAGGIIDRAFVDTSYGDVAALLAINVAAPYACAQHAARQMMAAGGGKIINIGSVFACAGVPGFSAYAASKGAITALTKSLAVELAPHNIQVNAVVPGYFRTSMTEDALDDQDLHDRIVRRIPARRVGRPSEAAAAVRYLASPEADFVTGTCLTIDGGFVSQ